MKFNDKIKINKSFEQDLNSFLNYFLYGPKNKDDKFNNNIFNYLMNKNIIKECKNKISLSQKEIKVHYDQTTKEYYEDFFEENENYLNYFGSSLSNDKNGLQRSQLKTLTTVFKNYKYNNKYIGINGAPGTGKSTLVNYIISNILINSLVEEFRSKNNVKFVNFLKKDFKSPKIFLTGLTINSVKNLSDICKINFPEEHKWINQDLFENKEKYKNIFEKVDIQYSKKYEEIDEQSGKINIIKNNYFDNNLFENKDGLKEYFIDKFNKHFNKNVLWDQIPDLLFEKLNININKIEKVNSLIYDIIEKNKSIDYKKYVQIIIYKNKINNIVSHLNVNPKQIDLIVSELKDFITFLKNIFKYNPDEKFFKFIEKFCNKYQNKKLRFLKNIKLKKIKKILVSIIDKHISNEHSLEFFEKKFNDTIDSLLEIKELQNDLLEDYNFEEFRQGFNNDKVLKLMYILDIVKINFNNIQQKLDTLYRTENIFIYRHILEWLFINNIQNIKEDNFFEHLNILKPILSSNLQSLRRKDIWTILNIKESNRDNIFDWTIIDEASQASWIYIPFLLYSSKNIIAVGDEKQLKPVEDFDKNKYSNKLDQMCDGLKIFKENFNEGKYKDIYEIYMNGVEKFYLDYKWNYEIKNFFENELKLIYKKSDRFYLHNSIMEWINNISKVRSCLNLENKDSNYQNGTFLLEHFRCPEYIFNIFNDSFYNKELIYGKPIDENSCSFSQKNIFLCSELSYIQLEYQNIEEKDYLKKNINLKEIKIVFNFVIDNLNLFLKHNKSTDELEYLKENILLVSLYTNQVNLMKLIASKISNNENKINILEKSIKEINFKINNPEIELTKKIVEDICYKLNEKINNKEEKTIELIRKLFSEIQIGTIDSTQGLGADFVICSYVDNEIIKTKIDHITDAQRINVLWSRTKKHFIQICSNNYLTDSSKQVDQKFNFRKKWEIGLDSENTFIAKFNVENKDDLEIKKLWNSFNQEELEKLSNSSKWSYIGRFGEKLFNNLINDPLFTKILTKKIIEDAYNEKYSKQYKNVKFETKKWENENYESYKNYDFIIDDKLYIDVKSSDVDSEVVWLSEKEQDFALNNEYLIAKLNNIGKFNLNIKQESSKAFVLEKLSFYRVLKNKENKKVFLKNYNPNNNTKIKIILRDN